MIKTFKFGMDYAIKPDDWYRRYITYGAHESKDTCHHAITCIEAFSVDNTKPNTHVIETCVNCGKPVYIAKRGLKRCINNAN